MQIDKNILVTGGGGFLGSHLIGELLSQGASVLCMSRSLPAGCRYYADCQYELVDLRDREETTRVIKSFRPEVVYHLASRPDAQENFDHAHMSVADNLSGTINVLEAFHESSRAEVFVYGDSVKIYGNVLPPFNHDSIPAPNSSYAISKLAGWHFCQLFSRSSDFNVVSVRPNLIFGYLQPFNLIHFVIKSILEGEPEITLMGGSQTRSPLYIGDAVQAYIQANEVAQTQNLKTMLVSGKTEMSVIGIAELIAEILESPIRIKKSDKDQRDTEITRSYVDLEQTYQEFAWRPRYSLADGLRATIEQYLQYQPVSGNKLASAV